MIYLEEYVVILWIPASIPYKRFITVYKVLCNHEYHICYNSIDIDIFLFCHPASLCGGFRYIAAGYFRL